MVLSLHLAKLELVKKLYVYILTNKNHTVLYIGVTSNLEQRVYQHKTKFHPKSFTARYNIDRLIYFEEFSDATTAIKREKQLKRYKREFKRNLIEKDNPEWRDLSEGWYSQANIDLGIRVNKDK
jgi:putative endonuclease